MDYHEPVLVREVLERLQVTPGMVVCDGTVGSAGHGVRLVEALQGQGVFIGLDRDPEMLKRAQRRLAALGGGENLRLVLRARSYEQLPEVLAEEGFKGADAILLDLGLNSLQLEDGARGFSFSNEGPLDGRFNPKEPGTRSMEELVNNASEKELSDWMFQYADERNARKIARRIVETRKARPIRTTKELADLVVACYPPKKRHEKPHPATRTFQALRIVANNELQAVENGVRRCIESLAPGGTLCVISYHSGEEKLVKSLFDEVGSPRPDPTNLYAATTMEGLQYRVESRGAYKPRENEIAENPRARSARLRTLHRLREVAQ